MSGIAKRKKKPMTKNIGTLKQLKAFKNYVEEGKGGKCGKRDFFPNDRQ